MMESPKYLSRAIYAIVAISICTISYSSTAHADSAYDVTVKIIDAATAEIRLTYPVTAGTSAISALSSKKEGVLLDGHRELISANAQDGTLRTISNDTATTDAQISLLPGDKNITLTYRLSNVLGGTDISLFNFLLFLGATYPTTAHVRISFPTGFEVLSYSAGTNTEVASDGTIRMDIDADRSSALLSAKNLNLLVYPKPSSGYIKKKVGDFTIIGSRNKVDQVSPIVSGMTYARGMFEKLFGASLPRDIDLVIVPIRGQTSYYEPAGLSLGPNIILIDPEDLLFNVGPNDPAKTIIHELGHLAVSNKKIFSGQMYYARWLDEGLAVFGEEYATDNYIIRTEKDRQADTVLSSIKKMTLEELKAEYAVPFDYHFSIDTTAQPVKRTYAHAGLIMYDLYLRDATLIPRSLDALKSNQGNVTCKMCDTDTALAVLQNLSGLQKEEILYPFKNSLTSTDRNLSQLTITPVDSSIRQSILDSTYQKVGSYIDKDAPVEEFTIPGSKKPISSQINASDVKKNVVTQKVATSTITLSNEKEVRQDMPRSFFGKIWRWIADFF